MMGLLLLEEMGLSMKLLMVFSLFFLRYKVLFFIKKNY